MARRITRLFLETGLMSTSDPTVLSGQGGDDSGIALAVIEWTAMRRPKRASPIGRNASTISIPLSTANDL